MVAAGQEENYRPLPDEREKAGWYFGIWQQGATEHGFHWLREKKITNSFLNGSTIRQQKSSAIPRFNACVPCNLRPGQDRERPLVFTSSHPTQGGLPFCLAMPLCLHFGRAKCKPGEDQLLGSLIPPPHTHTHSSATETEPGSLLTRPSNPSGTCGS